MMIAGIEDRLRRLEDEQDILKTLYAYGHSIDYGLEADWLDCWCEDGVLHWPNREPIRGHAALLEAFNKHTHAPQAFHKHIIVEPRIRFEGGAHADRATVDTYFARLDRYETGPATRSMGRYRDKLERCADGRWRFRERVAEREASRPGTPIGAHAPV